MSGDYLASSRYIDRDPTHWGPMHKPSPIHPTAVIEGIVGHGTTVGAHAWIGPHVTIGDNCVIGPGACIGQDGFGYENVDGRWVCKPQSHGVVIGDDVHIGAGTCIARGSWRDTIIESGTRIDSSAFIAHNVHIGRDVMIVANAGLGGSVTVNAGAWIGLNACVHQRVEIGEKALVAMGAVVLKDVDADTTVAGVPAKVIDSTQGVRDSM